MYMLLRYDTEGSPEDMAGFLKKAHEVHTAEDIPATFFCTGQALDTREAEFREFAAAIADDERLDAQDHSYSHIGVCYEAGRPVDELRADYARSVEAHRRVLGAAPLGTAICGTSGRDGEGLPGFDATEKSRDEFAMLTDLGIRMINTRLTGFKQARQFCNYARLDRPDVMGYPSDLSDTGWFYKKDFDQAMAFITDRIRQQAGEGDHMAIVFHDWCSWNCAPDRSLDHVRRIADVARDAGYKLRNHRQCYSDKPLWMDADQPACAG